MDFNEKIDPGHTALLVVDVQNDFCHPEGALGAQGMNLAMIDEMIVSLNELIASARKFEVPIIFIQTVHQTSTDSDTWIERLKNADHKNLCRKNTWGADFYKLEPDPDDIVIKKHRYSGFINTRLDSVLRTLKIRTLIMTGVSTNVCVESTARDGFMMDYAIVFLSDCTAAYSKESHEMTLSNMDQYFGGVYDSARVMTSWHSLQCLR